MSSNVKISRVMHITDSTLCDLYCEHSDIPQEYEPYVIELETFKDFIHETLQKDTLQEDTLIDAIYIIEISDTVNDVLLNKPDVHYILLSSLL